MRKENLENTDLPLAHDKELRQSAVSIDTIGGKSCSKCGKYKPYCDFGWRVEAIGSRMSQCRECRSCERVKKLKPQKNRKVSTLQGTSVIDVSADDFIESSHINYLTDLAIDLFLDFSHKNSDQDEAA